MKIFNSITDTIGHTPLVRLNHASLKTSSQILLKLEFMNPLGSVKDRTALKMIESAEQSGKLKMGQKVLEPSSGNMGISLAMVCASKGYPLTVIMPETGSMERRMMLLLLGAEVILTPAEYGTKGAFAYALELAESDQAYYMPNQFYNLTNRLAHQETTAVEIWNDTDGRVDVVVAGVGTGGTLSGIAEYLKRKKPSVRTVAVEPDESAVLSGEPSHHHPLQGIGASFISANVSQDQIDQIERIPAEEAIAMARHVIRTEGIPVGLSSGAAIVGALRVAARSQGQMIVAIVPSYTERYLSTVLGEDAHQRAQNLKLAPVKASFLETIQAHSQPAKKRTPSS